jgi:hypothetical protein
MRSTGIDRISCGGKSVSGIHPETTKKKLLFNPGRFAGNVSRGYLGWIVTGSRFGSQGLHILSACFVVCRHDPSIRLRPDKDIIEKQKFLFSGPYRTRISQKI